LWEYLGCIIIIPLFLSMGRFVYVFLGKRKDEKSVHVSTYIQEQKGLYNIYPHARENTIAKVQLSLTSRSLFLMTKDGGD